MFSNFLKNLSILKKFLFINLFFFTIIGLFTFLYLKNVQPNLIKKKSSNHIEVINNNLDYKDAYIGDSKYGFNQLTNISGINYFGYDMNTIFDEAGVNQINNEYVLDIALII